MSSRVLHYCSGPMRLWTTEPDRARPGCHPIPRALACPPNAPVSGAAGERRIDTDRCPRPLHWRVRRRVDVPRTTSCRHATRRGGPMSRAHPDAHRADDLPRDAAWRQHRLFRYPRLSSDCQRSPHHEPPGSGKQSHPRSPMLSQPGSPIWSHPGAAMWSHPAGGDRTAWSQPQLEPTLVERSNPVDGGGTWLDGGVR